MFHVLYKSSQRVKAKEITLSVGNPFKSMAPNQLRRAARQARLNETTSGLAPGFVQCNLVIISQDYAGDFADFCRRNPRPCPLLAVSPTPGDFSLPELGSDIDVRTDVPRYRRWENGA